MVRSDAWPLMVALALLFAAFGSDSFSAVLLAVLVMLPVPVPVAVSTRVALPPLPRPPMFQTPVALLYVPVLAVAETKLVPAGSWSVIWTPVASEGPLLVTVTVKSTLEPTVTVPLLATLATAMSAWDVTVPGSLTVSLLTSSSPPPPTVALLVRDAAAD